MVWPQVPQHPSTPVLQQVHDPPAHKMKQMLCLSKFFLLTQLLAHSSSQTTGTLFTHFSSHTTARCLHIHSWPSSKIQGAAHTHTCFISAHKSYLVHCRLRWPSRPAPLRETLCLPRLNLNGQGPACFNFKGVCKLFTFGAKASLLCYMLRAFTFCVGIHWTATE